MANPGDGENTENSQAPESQQASGSGSPSSNGASVPSSSSTPPVGSDMLADSMPTQSTQLHVSQLTLTTESQSITQTTRNLFGLCDNGASVSSSTTAPVSSDMLADSMPVENPPQPSQHTLITQPPATNYLLYRNVYALYNNGRDLMLSDGRMIQAPGGHRFVIKTKSVANIPLPTHATQLPLATTIWLCDNGRKLLMDDRSIIEAPFGQRFIVQTQKTPTPTAKEMRSVASTTVESEISADATNPPLSNSVQETSMEMTLVSNQVIIKY